MADIGRTRIPLNDGMSLNLVLFAALFLISPAWAQCPAGAVQGLTAYDCYVFGTVEVPWYDALERCKAQNGVLASVESGELNRFLVEHVRKEAPHWLGASSKVVSSNWTWLNGEKPLEYAKWAEGYPLNTSVCLALDVERSWWTSEDCTSEHLYVCRVPTTTVENWGYKKRQRLSALNASLALSNCSTSEVQRAIQLLEQQSSDDTKRVCPPYLTGIGIPGKCFRVTTEVASWVNALRLCKQWGGDLVAMHSDDEFIEITAFFKTLWPQSKFFHIGYYWTAGIGWRWTSGEPNDYTHAASPMNGPRPKECAYASTESSIGWKQQECDTEMVCGPYCIQKYDMRYHAVCQRPI